MTVLGALLVQPTAVEAHVVVEATRTLVERVQEEGATSRRESPHTFGFFADFAQQHCKKERTRIVVCAVALREVGNAERGVLEPSGRVGHPHEMIPPQYREFPRSLIERLRGQ